MKKKILLCLFATLHFYVLVSAQTLIKDFASTDGPVYATLVKGDSVYIGGDFNYVGTGTQRLARIKPGSVKPDIDFPQIISNENVINDVESDGAGGFYLAGLIREFNNYYILPTGIIHVLKDGSLDSNFQTVDIGSSAINSMKKKGNKLYVAGTFYSIQRTTRPYVAALNAVNGALDNWQPDAPSAEVFKINANDSLVFISGNFYQVGNVLQRHGFAALNKSTGKVLSDFPSPNGYASAIDVDDSTLFLGGNFNMMGYEKTGLGKINLAGTKIIPDFPSTDYIVRCILPDGKGGYYIAGNFERVDAFGRSNVAHILPNGKIDPLFFASVNYIVYSLAADNNNLYLAGEFTSVNGALRNHVASVSLSTGTLTNFNPDVNGTVYSIALRNDTLYMGGAFTIVKGKTRNNAASVTTSNKLTSWSPNVSGTVNKIILNSTGTSAYLGGAFYMVKNKTHRFLAKVNTTNGSPFNWNPAPDADVICMVLKDKNLYIQGLFYNVNNNYRIGLAAIDTSTGTPTSFKADAFQTSMDSYNGLSIYDNKLYVGGNFSYIQDSLRNKLARIDLTTGNVESWNPNVVSNDFAVNSVYANEKGVVFGGNFYFIGNTPRSSLAKIDLSNSQAIITPWKPYLEYYVSEVKDILHYKKDVFVAGSFAYSYTDGPYADSYMRNLMALNDSSGLVSHYFTQYPDNIVNSLCIFDNKLMVAGSFSNFINIQDYLSTTNRSYLSGYNLADFSLTSSLYNPNGNLKMATDTAGNLITAGNFTLMNSLSRRYLACINIKTGLPVLWNPKPSGLIYALAVNDSMLFAGGSFYQIGSNELYRQGLAAINTKNDEAISSWDAGINGDIYALAVKDNNLYVGGSFATIKNINRKYAASLKVANAQLQSWNPAPNDIVTSVLPLNNKVYLGGDFTTVKGTKRKYLAQVDNQSGIPSSWNPNPDYKTSHIISSGKNIFVTGRFTKIAALDRIALAAFDTSTGQITNFDARINYTSPYWCTLGPIVSYGKNLYVGGDYNFTSVGNAYRQYFAGIDTITQKATPFNPSPNVSFNNYYSYSYNSMYVANNKLFIGGNFTNISSSISNNYFAVYKLPVQANADASFVTLPLKTNAVADVVKPGVFPNPAHNECTVTFTGENSKKYIVSIVNIKGTVLMQTQVVSVRGTNTVHLNTAGLANGSYIVNISNESGLIKSLKLIKQ